ncbi:MAG: type I methionyl aminopeptidase [Candidatus Mcinerneyibacterium aminivorans]|uniref:Methionine aminopeptidase n=1 Tax=Candidatus Mcinerneyibacterium aminivorans TaxID=2703815 RepID=A0A5D0MEC6_9BACT|nr:MAG: type I methionyl aminopeptidase [Candidatus Mcinerneyibacterium aminivorans]
MREVNRIISDLFVDIKNLIKEGVSTNELDLWAENYIKERDAEPAFKGYRGFPSTLCVSINDEIIHGIPSEDKKLKKGDLVSIDVGAFKKEHYADAARTFIVGSTSFENRRLVNVTRKALDIGIKEAVPGNRIGDIGYVIQKYVEENGFNVVREFVGHGIGRKMHLEPAIPNYGEKNKGPLIEKGMCLAIEPMVVAGSYEVQILDDHWTAVTVDGKNAAHFENTIFISKEGPEVLTEINEGDYARK